TLEINAHEQSAFKWWENTVSIFKEITDKAGNDVTSKIRGICISSHTVTMLPVDESGSPLRNAITYQDSRSSGELDYIIDKVGYDRFVSIVGGQPAVAFLPNKILWFKKNEPRLFNQTKYFLQASSFINFKLTNKMTTDIDQAVRTQCYDIDNMCWSKDIGDVIGVDLDKMLPNPQAVNEVIGHVTDIASKQTGIPSGVPVLAGCSDAMASMYATGMNKLGDAGESSGTTSLVFVGSNQKSRNDIPVVTKPCSIKGMPWVFDAPIQTSGAAIKWFIDKMANEEVEYCKQNELNIYTYLNEIALESNPGANGLFFYPYLLGERAPLWNDYASGMFIGMRMNMKRSDMVRSVFEGTAFALRHVMETISESGGEATSLRICGGGAKSRTWSQIKASMLNIPICILDENSGDVPIGDAIIAGNKLGIFPDLTKAIEKIIKVKEVIMPNEEWVQIYDKLYPYYVEMYQDLDGSLERLKDTINEIY
ncbi:MAG: xylulokinase, partial [Suipraeoptans sp.]